MRDEEVDSERARKQAAAREAAESGEADDDIDDASETLGSGPANVAVGSMAESTGVAAMGPTVVAQGVVKAVAQEAKPTSSPSGGGRRHGDSLARPGEDDYPGLVGVDPAHYQRHGEIARGGMGRIVSARDRRLGREVALKELITSNEPLRARFEREVRITARLQHPATIGVLEAGKWPSGELFYSMNLIAGRSLDKVIAARSTLAARSGLIANVIAVADTMAYAHNLHIIHRDLKPANVLIGDYGETVVIDWGLAKDLADSSSIPDVSIGPYRTSDATTSSPDTEVGAIIGTPAYMPPEQASGDLVDERADVYALGAMLYHVLAGVPPYAGMSGAEVLVAVYEGPPKPILELQPETPRDLVTIIETAMAREPGRRYRSAKELATELRAFQSGSLVGGHRYTLGQLVMRWLRRYRTPVIVAGIATAALAVLAVVSMTNIVRERRAADAARAIAESERTRAQERDQDAEELMSFMLTDLKVRLLAVGKLDLLESVARKANEYYDARPELDSTSDPLKRIAAFTSIGDVLVSRGESGAALAAYRKAEATGLRILAARPGQPRIEAALLRAKLRVAVTQITLGEIRSARPQLTEAVAALEALVQRAPDASEAASDLVSARRDLGDLWIDLGDLPAAAVQYRAGIALASDWMVKEPGKRDWQRAAAIHHSQLAGALMLQGDIDGALAENRTDLALGERMAAADPTNVESQYDIAGAHVRIGDALRQKRDVPGTMAEYERALAVMKQLATRDPSNGDWQHDLAVAHDRVGNMFLEALGKPDAAMAEFRTSLAIKQALAARDPMNQQWARLHAVGWNKIAAVHAKQQRTAAALEVYTRAFGMFEALVRATPDDAALQRDFSVAHYNLGDMELDRGNAAAALPHHRAALAVSQKLVALDPTNTVWQADVVDSHGKVGGILAKLGQRAEAKAELEAGLATAERLAAADPGDPSWPELAVALKQQLAACCAR